MLNIGHYTREKISDELIGKAITTYNYHYDNTLYGAKVNSSVRKTARDLGMSQNLVHQILKDYRGIGEDVRGIKLRDKAKETFEREIAYNLGCYGVGRDEVSQIENILSEIQGRFHASGAEVRKAVDKFYDSSAGNNSLAYFPRGRTLYANPEHRIRSSLNGAGTNGRNVSEDESNIFYLGAKKNLRAQPESRVRPTNKNQTRTSGNLRRRLTNTATAVLAAIGIFSPNIDSKFDNVANALIAPLGTIEHFLPSETEDLIEPGYTLNLNPIPRQIPTVSPAQNTCLDNLVTDDKIRSAKLLFPELTDKMKEYIDSHRNQIITQKEFNKLDSILQGWYAGQVKVNVVNSDNDQKTISVVYSVNDIFNSSFEKNTGCKLHLIEFGKNGREVIEFNKPIEYVLSADEYNRWTNSGRLPYVVAVVSPNKTNADGVFDALSSFQYVLRPEGEKGKVRGVEREAEAVLVPQTTLDLSKWGQPIEAWTVRGN